MKEVILIDDMLPEHIEIDAHDANDWGLKTTKLIKTGETVKEFPIFKLPEYDVRLLSVFGEKIIRPDKYLSTFAIKHRIFPYWDCFLINSDEPNAVHDFKFK